MVRTESLYLFWFTLFNLYQFTLIISPKTNIRVMSVSLSLLIRLLYFVLHSSPKKKFADTIGKIIRISRGPWTIVLWFINGLQCKHRFVGRQPN